MAKRVFTEEERAEYREKMLDAGFDLLKQYGMTHMSVAKITEAAGIGVSTFYNFFASKEEYVYEVLQYRRRKIPELIRIALNGKEKAGPAETRTYLKMMIDERYSVFPSLTPEDEKRLLTSTMCSGSTTTRRSPSRRSGPCAKAWPTARSARM